MRSPAAAAAKQPAPRSASVQRSVRPLVFDGVTVVDVEQGQLLADQRVVITKNRITAVGRATTIKVPSGARIVKAQGKYLIPGLWDMQVYPKQSTEVFNRFFIAAGVTGIRNAEVEVPLDSLRGWRREILTGIRVGPPRQILVGPSITPNRPLFSRVECTKGLPKPCVFAPADVSRVVDSIKAAGADMIISSSEFPDTIYFAIAAAARRAGIPFGGHFASWNGMTEQEQSDSGASIFDAPGRSTPKWACWGDAATLEQCRPVAERFRQNNTWWVPALISGFGARTARSTPVALGFDEDVAAFWSNPAAVNPYAGRRSNDVPRVERAGGVEYRSAADSIGYAHIALEAGVPILAGTGETNGSDDQMNVPAGFALHAELALYVAEGLTPLAALQSATLNPAKMLRATDSLGTVAPGKLADLVLLDANPLADITNTRTVQAVVANGRYFDRTALDRLVADVKSSAKQSPAKRTLQVPR